MPLMMLKLSIPLPDKKRSELMAAASRIVAGSIGKPERYVMVTVEETPIIMSGEEGPAAFADVRSIGGLGGGVNGEIARKLCALLEEMLEIPPGRVYLTFTDVPAADWGHDGATFG